MDKQEIIALRSKMPQGYREILSKRTGKSISTIDVVMAGKRKGTIVLKEAIRLIKDHQKLMQEIEESIKDLK